MMANLFEIFIWIIVGLFYLGGLIWSFKDWWDQDNLLYKEDEAWYSNEHDEHRFCHLILILGDYYERCQQ
jgi:hypothetical protein